MCYHATSKNHIIIIEGTFCLEKFVLEGGHGSDGTRLARSMTFLYLFNTGPKIGMRRTAENG